jgi:predicted N-acetyltransferase YhbS
MGHNWDVRRWDGKYFYNPEGRWMPGWEQDARLWENSQGELVGCVNREGAGDAWIQIDPAHRFLEREMIEWAEQHLIAPQPGETAKAVEFTVFEYDALRQGLLVERRFEKMPYGGMFRHMRLSDCLLAPTQVASPYQLRRVDPENDGDCQQIADLLNAAFGRSFHNGPEFQSFARLSPCYVNELDLVAVAPNGVFAAYVGMPYDESNRRAIFEPVCTHPHHQRKGLAGALMREGLHRAQAMGAVDVIVDTGDMIPANALYDSLGFTEAYKAFAWRKVFASEAART